MMLRRFWNMTFKRIATAFLLFGALPFAACRQEATDDGSDQGEGRRIPAEAIDHTIQFPAGKPFGVVKVRTIGSTEAKDWIEVSDATGAVGIRKNKEVMLSVQNAAEVDFSVLDQLRPADIQELNLEKSGVTDEQFAHVAHLTSLTGLNANGNPISDEALVHLESLTNLKKVALGATKITSQGMVHIAKLAGLQKLWLQDTAVGDDGMKQLAGLANLQSLILYRTPVSDAGLASLKDLPALQRLGLEGTQITDAGLANLPAMKALTEVSVVSTAVTQEGVDKIKNSIPDCNIVTK